MATKDDKKAGSGKGDGGKGKGGGGKKREAQQQPQVEHAGKNLPVPPPRLCIFYDSTVRDRRKNQCGFTNRHQSPNLEKIVINCGVGEAIKNPKILDTVFNELGMR